MINFVQVAAQGFIAALCFVWDVTILNQQLL